MIDTHSHIYSQEFDADSFEMIGRAQEAGVKHIILPNVDSESLPRMLALESRFPGYCHAAIGLHPTSVGENFREELTLVRAELERRPYVAIGEIGMDLYWDKTHIAEQSEAFVEQLNWALEYQLPVIVHVRSSFSETMKLLAPFRGKGLRGVFHCFSGSIQEAEAIIRFGGFMLGINGVVTFKNARLPEVLLQVGLEHIVLETDAPYLTPVPHRGERNESAYVKHVCEKIAAVFDLPVKEVEYQTTKNASQLFGLE